MKVEYESIQLDPVYIVQLKELFRLRHSHALALINILFKIYFYFFFFFFFGAIVKLNKLKKEKINICIYQKYIYVNNVKTITLTR